MPRVPIPIRAPFGGLQVNSAQRAVDPRDCVDCREVHTTFGSINKRPGINKVANGVADADATNFGTFLKSFRVGSNGYLVTRYRVLDTNGFTVYSLPVPTDTSTPGLASYGDRIYYAAGGVGNYTIYTIGSSFTRVTTGISAPIAAAVAADIGGVGDLPNDDYSYRITYYNNNLGVESGPSPVGLVTAGGGSNAIAISSPVTTDGQTQVTHYRAYRKQIGTDTTWYFVAQALIGVAINDSVYDISRTSADAISLVEDTPPASTIIAWHKDRMWWGVGTSTPRDIRPSEVNKPEAVNPLQGYRVVDNNGDYMIEAVSIKKALLIFNLKSLWAITGSGLSSFRPDHIADIGCAGRYSICKIGGYVYWAARDGVYRTAGGEPEYLSREIEDLWRAMFDPGFFFESLTGGYEPLSGCYVLSGRNVGGGFTRSLAYSISRGKWFEWAHGCSGFSNFEEIIAQRPQTYTVRITAPDALALYRFNDQEHDDGGAGNRTINWRWTTPNMDLGTTRDKRFFYASPSWDSGGNDPLSVDAAINHGVLANVGQINMNATRQRRPFRLGRMGNTLQLRLSGTSQNRVSVAGVDVEVEPIGNR